MALTAAGLVFALAETKNSAEAELIGNIPKTLLAYKLRAQFCHLTFRPLRERMIKVHRRYHAENAVADELKPFVADASVLIGIGRVRQRRYKKAVVAEAVIQFILKFFHRKKITPYYGSRTQQDRQPSVWI